MPSVPQIVAAPVPTGGAITLAISGAPSGSFTLTRSVSGVSGSTVLASGSAPIPLFIDIGDGLPAPLSPTAYYQYAYSDVSGSTTTDFIQPAAFFTVEQEPLTTLLVRLIQGAFNSLALPAGIKRPQVTNAMPLGGAIPLPLVVVNLDIGQQAATPIGQSLAAAAGLSSSSGVGASLITGFIRRVYRVSVLASDATTRDFYRDTLIGIFEALYAPVFLPLGLDVVHRWQFSSGQVAQDKQAMMPGFYFADVMLEFEGTFNVLISPTFGRIATITTTVSGASEPEQTPTTITITVPTVTP